MEIIEKKEKRINWERDEYILVLDLYFDQHETPPDKKDFVLKEMSQLLKMRAKNIGLQVTEKFRNTNGIYMRLMNFRHLDPDIISKGLMAPAPIGVNVWNEYSKDKQKLKKDAERIRNEIIQTFEANING